jgi:MFS family permease
LALAPRIETVEQNRQLRDLLTPTVLIPLLAMLAIQSLMSMADFAVPVLAPEAAVDIGVAPTLIGTWVAGLYGAAMVSGLAAGPWVQRYGAIRVSQAALVLSAAGLGLFVLAHPAMAMLSAICLGIAYGTVNPASSGVLARHTPARWRAFVFSIKQSGVTLGGALAGAITPVLAAWYGWQTAALILAVVLVLLAVLVQPTRTRIDIPSDAGAPTSKVSIIAPIRLILAHRLLRWLTVAAVLYSGVQVCLFSFLVVYLTGAVGMPLTIAGFAYAAFQSGGIAGRIIWGSIAGGIVSARVLLILLGLATACFLIVIALFAQLWPIAIVFVLSVILGGCALGWNGLYMSEVARLAPDGRIGEATGGAQFFFFAGAMAVPPAFGLLVELSGGYDIPFAVIAVMSVGASTAVALADDPAAEPQEG